MTGRISCSRPKRDQWVRIVLLILGSILVAAALLGYFTPWGYVGVSLLITAGLGHCPACRLMGIDPG